MRLDNLLQASYWFLPPSSPLGTASAVLLLVLALAWCGANLAWRARTGHPLANSNLVAGVVFGIAMAGRLLGVPVLTLRAWWLVAGLIALLPAVARAGPRVVALLPRAAMIGSLVIIAAAIAWSAWTASVIRTRGVTGSDPYAYVQMGVDLAERGTLFHSFPLVRVTYDLGISSAPVVHVGYLIPKDVRRVSATVWPPGYAVFTAAAYALAGETGVYWLTPIMALLALLVLAWVTAGLPQRNRAAGVATAALAVALTATSYQQIEWQMIPMADIGAQLFSLLALGLALRAPAASRPGARLLAVSAGLALGIAFDLRYTQVLIAPALVCALWRSGDPRGFVVRAGVCAGAALVAAAPVLAYHAVAFGSPFAVGSEELQHFSLAGIPATLARLAGELSLPVEFGLLWPWIGAGAALLAVSAPRVALSLALYCGVLLLFHGAYAYLRPRDLLSVFPVLYLMAGYGWVRGVLLVRAAAARIALATVMAVVIVLLFWSRSEKALMLPITRGFATFGYLYAPQRDSFDRIAELTPAGSAIGTSLNGGGVDLYSRRLAFRPGYWTPTECVQFVRALQAEGTPVFVLDDGVEMNEPLAALRSAFTLTEVGRFDLPYYEFRGGGSANRKVPLLRVDP